MDTSRMSAMIIGVLFIVATVSAIGAVLYNPILKNPYYLVKGPTRRNQITLGALFELTAAAAIVGTAIAFFPFLKQGNESIALGYIGFRLFEAVIIVIGLISLLSLLTLRQEFASGAALDTSSLQTAGKSLLAIHAWTSVLGPNFMLGINTLMFSFLLYQTRLVPGPIAVMGLIGATLIFIAALLEMFGVILPISLWKVVLALPVASYEMILAVYLIVKGFN